MPTSDRTGRGLFLTFEGVDGTGKTTQIRRCADYLERLGLPVVQTREPGGTRVGEAIRGLLLDPKTEGLCTEAEFLLFSASRAQHVHEVIGPALERGQVVLCDRYLDSSVAYQGVARGLGPEKVLRISLDVVGAYVPARTFWLDLPPLEAVGRALGALSPAERRERARFELEALSFHEAVREGFRWCQEHDPVRVVRLDATGTADAVFQRLRPHLDELARRPRP